MMNEMNRCMWSVFREQYSFLSTQTNPNETQMKPMKPSTNNSNYLKEARMHRAINSVIKETLYPI